MRMTTTSGSVDCGPYQPHLNQIALLAYTGESRHMAFTVVNQSIAQHVRWRDRTRGARKEETAALEAGHTIFIPTPTHSEIESIRQALRRRTDEPLQTKSGELNGVSGRFLRLAEA